MKKTILGMVLIASTMMAMSCNKNTDMPVTNEKDSTVVVVDSVTVKNDSISVDSLKSNQNK
jgi:hypothetical protein